MRSGLWVRIPPSLLMLLWFNRQNGCLVSSLSRFKSERELRYPHSQLKTASPVPGLTKCFWCFALVAQSAEAAVLETVGCRFESCRGYLLCNEWLATPTGRGKRSRTVRVRVRIPGEPLAARCGSLPQLAEGGGSNPSQSGFESRVSYL